MKRSDSDERNGSNFSTIKFPDSLAADQFVADDDSLDETQEALDALERESALEAEFKLDFEGQFNDAPDLDDDNDPVDETTMIIVAYLDNELSEEERDNFEKRLLEDSKLRERVESERLAINAVDELRKEPTTVDLTEQTVDKLNTEAKEELERILLRNEARERRAHAVQFAIPFLLFVLGYLLFAAFAPNVSRQRERDANVVERLAQLEAVGDYEYLRALADSNVFEKWREALKTSRGRFYSQRAQFSRNTPEVSLNDAADAENASAIGKGKSYKELLRDPVFYRLQRRFEALDEPTRNKWRELRRQIDADPDREKLLQTLDDYTSWLVSSTNQTERLRLEDAPIPGRIMEIRRKLDESIRIAELGQTRQNNGGNNNQNPGAAKERPANDGKANAPQLPQQPNMRPGNNERNNQRDRLGASLRSALPDPLQRENLHSVYNKYVEYRRAHEHQGATDGEHDDVLDFLTNVPVDEIVADFSQESKDVINELEPQQRSSLIGLVVSLSFLENADNIVQTRPMQWGRRNNNGFNYGFQRGDSVQTLAKTLRNANQETRDFITSCPALEAHGILMSLQWGFFRYNAFDQNNPGRRGDEGMNPNPPQEIRRDNVNAISTGESKEKSANPREPK